jgi:hypothetical protein
MGKPTLFIIRKEMDILRPFVIRVTREEDLLQVEYLYRTMVKGEQKDFLVLGYRLTREFLEKRNDWKDNTQFGMHLKDYDISYMHSCVRIIQQFVDSGLSYADVCAAVSAHMPRFNTINRNGYLINISAASYIGKVSSVEAHVLIPAYRVINWVQKLKSTKFTECCVNLAADPACTVEVITGDRTQDICNSSEIYKDLIHKDEAIKQQVWRPKLKLTQQPKRYPIVNNFPSRTHSLLRTDLVVEDFTGVVFPDESVTFDVQLVREWYGDEIHSPAEIYLECVNGYLPKTRIRLDENGHGTFRFISLGLEKGDIMKVKAGFRFMTNSAEADIAII